MLSTIFTTSDQIRDNRTIQEVFTYAVEEIGELATEVNIVTGFSTKQPGKDGIVGEAIDAIICLVDLIGVYDPNITEEQIIAICRTKLNKWAETKLQSVE